MPSSTARFVAATRVGHVAGSARGPEPRDADWPLDPYAPPPRPVLVPTPQAPPRERVSFRRLLALVRLVRA